MQFGNHFTSSCQNNCMGVVMVQITNSQSLHRLKLQTWLTLVLTSYTIIHLKTATRQTSLISQSYAYSHTLYYIIDFLLLQRVLMVVCVSSKDQRYVQTALRVEWRYVSTTPMGQSVTISGTNLKLALSVDKSTMNLLVNACHLCHVTGLLYLW